MKRPINALIFALVSLILSPILLFIEFTAIFGAAMITYEPNNPLWVKAIAVTVVVLIGLLATALPLFALIVGTKSRAATKLVPTKGAGLATAAVVIAGIVTTGVAATQVYLVVGSFG